jgi:hypothetical protein
MIKKDLVEVKYVAYAVSVCSVYSLQDTPHASAGGDTFGSYIAREVLMHSPGSTLAMNV